ncbi:MAG: PEP-CTERM sorting domain-containing protein [Limisphaerales bacterium]
MKNLSIIAAVLFLSLSSFAQGTVFFNNRTSTGDARFTRPDGTGLGAGYTAQLYLVNGSVLTPLTPTTTFRTTSAAAAFFVNAVDVVVPGVPAGSPATFRVRIFETAAGSYDAAAASMAFLYGETADVQVAQLGGITPTGGIVPTPDLAGLQPLVAVPEPTTLALGILGAAALLYRRRS